MGEMRGAKTEMTGKWNLLLLFSCPMSLAWPRGRRLALLSTSSIKKIEPSGINTIPRLLILYTLAKECQDHNYTAWKFLQMLLLAVSVYLSLKSIDRTGDKVLVSVPCYLTSVDWFDTYFGNFFWLSTTSVRCDTIWPTDRLMGLMGLMPPINLLPNSRKYC